MMKQLYALLLLFLISFSCFADAKLTFQLFVDKTNSQQLQYHIKNGILRLNESSSGRINIFNETKQQFTSINKSDGNISRIDKEHINQQVEHLNKQRLSKLAQLEKGLQEKMKDMSGKDKSMAETMVNQLKYPEFYGAHTFLKVKKTPRIKTINQFKCQVYNIRRNEKLLKQICMASRKTLGLSQENYKTLRNFYHFNYTIQSQLLLAMGKTNFDHIDYEQEKMDGIPVEILPISGSGSQPELKLTGISHDLISEELFKEQNIKK